MQQSYKKSKFPHFLRKWSESIRMTLLSNYLNLKQALFLSTFIFVAGKMCKKCKVCLSFPQFSGSSGFLGLTIPPMKFPAYEDDKAVA